MSSTEEEEESASEQEEDIVMLDDDDDDGEDDLDDDDEDDDDEDDNLCSMKVKKKRNSKAEASSSSSKKKKRKKEREKDREKEKKPFYLPEQEEQSKSRMNRPTTSNVTATSTSSRRRFSSAPSFSYSLLVLKIVLLSLCCWSFSGRISGNHRGGEGSLFCDALSLSSSSSLSSTSTKTNTNLRLEYFDPDTQDNDTLLTAIQECRRTSFPAEKKNFLNSERDFVAAKSVTDKKKICAIIYDQKSSLVIGTADLEPKYKYIQKQKTYIPEGVVTNVFVRPDQRGQKFGQQLMIEGIEEILVQQLLQNVKKNPTGDNNNNNDNDNTINCKLSLDVYTQNKPAIALYFKLGYKPDGLVHESVYKTSQLFRSNLLVSLTKSISVVPTVP